MSQGTCTICTISIPQRRALDKLLRPESGRQCQEMLWELEGVLDGSEKQGEKAPDSKTEALQIQVNSLYFFQWHNLLLNFSLATGQVSASITRQQCWPCRTSPCCLLQVSCHLAPSPVPRQLINQSNDQITFFNELNLLFDSCAPYLPPPLL